MKMKNNNNKKNLLKWRGGIHTQRPAWSPWRPGDGGGREGKRRTHGGIILVQNILKLLFFIAILLQYDDERCCRDDFYGKTSMTSLFCNGR